MAPLKGPLKALSLDGMPSLQRQHLLSEFAGLKQACPEGVFVSLTPGDPTLWTAVLFVRDGPYAQAVLRFHISFPDCFPKLPPLVTFSTEMFHPLISPLTTYMYTTDIHDNGTVSARDDERLPPGGFSLRHGFPQWFGRGRRVLSGSRQVSSEQARGPASAQTSRAPSSVSSPESGDGTVPSYMRRDRRDISVYHVLKYIRSTFDQDHVLDSVPLEAAGNPGAWHAWRTHRRKLGKLPAAETTAEAAPPHEDDAASGQSPARSTASTAKRPGEWNWDGVWEDRVNKGIAASLSDAVLYGGSGTDELIRFLAMEEGDVAAIKDNICRTLGSAA
ncbi:hypothetical protein CDD83_8747 [Cordyceps sp. RAO-2017]|nr:hypothetical protein CDD83_8747 [Cordyceps sp. RAO-2017]